MRIATFITSLFVTFLFGCTAQQPAPLESAPDNNTLLWEISGKNIKEPSYLYGTFHLLCKKDVLLSNNLRTAVKRADEVYFELDLDDPASTLGMMFFMNMRSGKQLSDLTTPEEYRKIKTFFRDSVRTDIRPFEKMKPMLLEVLMYPRMMPCKSSSGVDMEILSLAKKEKKEIRGLETVQFQASIFDSIPYEKQVQGLLRTIDSSAKYRAYFNQMMNFYINQQTVALEEVTEDTTFSPSEDPDILLKNRNINWVKQMRDLLPKKDIFYAVGAGHLFGKDGVIALLRREGYTVRALENKKTSE